MFLPLVLAMSVRDILCYYYCKICIADKFKQAQFRITGKNGKEVDFQIVFEGANTGDSLMFCRIV